MLCAIMASWWAGDTSRISTRSKVPGNGISRPFVLGVSNTKQVFVEALVRVTVQWSEWRIHAAILGRLEQCPFSQGRQGMMNGSNQEILRGRQCRQVTSFRN